MDQLSVEQSQKAEQLLSSLIERAEAKTIFLTERIPVTKEVPSKIIKVPMIIS